MNIKCVNSDKKICVISIDNY